MVRWLTSMLFLFALATGVPAGTAFAENGMDKNVCPMKCCKKNAAKSTEPNSDEVALCRTLNCSTPSPSNSSSLSQANFSPNLVLVENFSHFAELFESSPAKIVQPFIPELAERNHSQPIYIQFKSFLI